MVVIAFSFSYEKYKLELAEKNRAHGSENAGEKHQFQSFKNALVDFQRTPRIRTNESIIEFWEQKKDEMPTLYNIACVIHGTPGTQVSVEQLFSQVHYILNDYRERTSEENLNNILLVRVNFKKLKSVFF